MDVIILSFNHIWIQQTSFMINPNSMRRLYNTSIYWIISFLAVYQQLIYSLTALLFFLLYLTKANNLISNWAITTKPALMIPIHFICIWTSSLAIAVISHNNLCNFTTLLLNWYNNRLIPIIRQFFIIPDRTDFKELKLPSVTSCSNQFSSNLITTCQYTPFQLSQALLTST